MDDMSLDQVLFLVTVLTRENSRLKEEKTALQRRIEQVETDLRRIIHSITEKIASHAAINLEE